jgi:thermostable 8-oxoguanine DNA glycosylase
MMIDPHDVTNFSRSEAELQEYLMFCLAVAGKKASMIAGKLHAFLSGMHSGEDPFQYVLRLHATSLLEAELRKVGMGKYDLLGKAYPAVAEQFRGRLAHVPISELESIRGIGPKTARYFALHSRRTPGEIAVIDTHVMKYLRHLGHKVPKRLPTRSNYGRLEGLMIAAAKASRMSMADFDLAVWSHYASGGSSPLPSLHHQEALAA